MEALKKIRVERAIEDIGRRLRCTPSGSIRRRYRELRRRGTRARTTIPSQPSWRGLSVCRDLTPWTMRFVLDGAFPLLDEFKIDPRPLYGFNTPATASALFQATFHTTIADVPLQLDAPDRGPQTHRARHLLGRNTTQKMSYVEACTDRHGEICRPSDSAKARDSLARLLARTVELLQKSLPRQPTAKRQVRLSAACLARIAGFSCRLRAAPIFFRLSVLCRSSGRVLHRLRRSCGGDDRGTPWSLAGSRRGAGRDASPSAWTRRRMVVPPARWRLHLFRRCVMAIAPRHRVRSQVDDTIANIHWTVYAWLLDPLLSRHRDHARCEARSEVPCASPGDPGSAASNAGCH